MRPCWTGLHQGFLVAAVVIGFAVVAVGLLLRPQQPSARTVPAPVPAPQARPGLAQPMTAATIRVSPVQLEESQEASASPRERELEEAQVA